MFNKDILKIKEVFNTIFEEKFLSFYLIGSYAENYAINSSDIDGFIILTSVTDKEIKNAYKLMEFFWENSLFDLDISIIQDINILTPLNNTEKMDAFLIKNNSYLFFGKDIKNNIPEINLKDYLDISIKRPIHFISRVRKIKNPSYPIDYPNKKDPYFGYCNRKILINGKKTKSTKELLVNVGWIATALIALKAEKMVLNKNDCLAKYKEYVNDEWFSFIEEIFSFCRNNYEYKIPKNKKDKLKLIELCKKALEFENYFLKNIEQ
ncbi:MAG: hypothetical protein U0457_02595 [Candidatus Sericytochromatia bacterium]